MGTMARWPFVAALLVLGTGVLSGGAQEGPPAAGIGKGPVLASNAADEGPAPSMDYGDLVTMQVMAYDNATNALTLVGDCLVACEGTSRPGMDGECRFADDWRVLPEQPHVNVHLQYLGLGACAAVWTERAAPGSDQWRIVARTQCREVTGSTDPLAYRTEVAWRWLDAQGGELASDRLAVVFPSTTLVCPNWVFYSGQVAMPGASWMCGQALILKDGAPFRATAEFCAR